MTEIDANALSDLLTKRFSVAFKGSTENVDGGRFAVVRPADLERGNGFSIVVGRTPKRVEASFRADRFAGALLRQMSEADNEARLLFDSLLTEAVKNNITVSATLNDVGIKIDADLNMYDGSKIEIDCDKRLVGRLDGSNIVNDTIFEVTSTCAGLILSLLPLEDSREFPPIFEEGLPEGASMKVTVNRYERNRNNRAACIAHHGDNCAACGFNFGDFYGSVGQGVIEVHHKVMVSQMGGSYRLNPKTDLIPVCANCHTIIHRRDPPLTIEELRTKLYISKQ